MFLAFLILQAATSKAEDLQTDLMETSWYLPLELNDRNTSISFEIDSTWHLIHGKTSGIRGRVWLEEPNDPKSIHGDVSIPVSLFDTDNSSRDERLREVMNAKKFGDVTFSINLVEKLCLPQSLIPNEGCSGSATGSLSIGGHEEVVPLIFLVTRTLNGFTIVGTAVFSWRIFPIEDPSILVAQLDDDVKVSFTVDTTARSATSDATAEKQDSLP